jgi:hypothetical protein
MFEACDVTYARALYQKPARIGMELIASTREVCTLYQNGTRAGAQSRPCLNTQECVINDR